MTLAPFVRRSLSDDVVDRLRRAIVRGTYVPGERLSETALAAAFDVSRGPIREALTVLEREGLLKLERHRGARVALLERSDVDDIYELRTALERLAFARAAKFAGDDDVAALEAIVGRIAQAVATRDVDGVVELDILFHDRVYRAAKHERLYASWSVLRPQIERLLFSRSIDQQNYFGRAVEEHVALLEAIRSHAIAEAVGLIEEHIQSAHQRLTQRLLIP